MPLLVSAAQQVEAAERTLIDMIESFQISDNRDFMQWEKGCLMLRKGKLCEMLALHQHEDPPYLEVRMLDSDNIVGTEVQYVKAFAKANGKALRAAHAAVKAAAASLDRVEQEAADAQAAFVKTCQEEEMR